MIDYIWVGLGWWYHGTEHCSKQLAERSFSSICWYCSGCSLTSCLRGGNMLAPLWCCEPSFCIYCCSSQSCEQPLRFFEEWAAAVPHRYSGVFWHQTHLKILVAGGHFLGCEGQRASVLPWVHDHPFGFHSPPASRSTPHLYSDSRVVHKLNLYESLEIWQCGHWSNFLHSRGLST